LKKLILSRDSYFDRVPDQSLIAENCEKYNRSLATRTDHYAFIYNYNGREMEINMSKMKGDTVKASWYDPRTGESTVIGAVEYKGVQTIKPEGGERDGNEWVLILDSV